MPVGAPREESQRGKRFSNGRRSAVPNGEAPASSSKRIPATAIRFPIFENRVRHNSRPHIVRVRIKLDGTTRNPIIFGLENTLKLQIVIDTASENNPFHRSHVSNLPDLHIRWNVGREV
jgi:hypothetical protein